MRPYALSLLLVAALAAGSAQAGSFSVTGSSPSTFTWSQRDGGLPGARRGHVAAFDLSSQQILMFGGNGGMAETWRWDGTSWSQHATAVGPSARTSSAASLDAARGRVVLYGGSAGGDETWEWNGSDWTLRAAASGPPALSGHALTYDGRRLRTVLFGGSSPSGLTSATWQWDGAEWTAASPAESPTPRMGSSMAYDANTGRVILFGGLDAGGVLADTWAWDGTTWTLLAPAASPSARSGHSMAFDAGRKRVVLFGGAGAGGALSDETWEWDGANWIRFTVSVGPQARSGSALAYDVLRGRTVLFAGGGSTDLRDTWEWDGTQWTQVSPIAAPAGRFAASASEGPGGTIVLFGGDGSSNAYRSDTHVWNGVRWSEANPTTKPDPRRFFAMAYDGARARSVLFGGFNGVYLQDVWEWDGASWIEGAPLTKPSIRSRPGMAYATHLGATIMFGGQLGAGGLGQDTWSWNGSDWTELVTAHKPPGRQNPYIAYDAARRKVVLFGGSISTSPTDAQQDTWEFDGTDWTEVFPATKPSKRTEGAMVFDPVRQRCLIFGGRLGTGSASDESWTYDGTTWTQLSPAEKPQQRVNFAMAYDPSLSSVLVHGGTTGPVPGADTWLLGSESPSVTVSYSPDALTAGTPIALTASFSGDGAPLYRYVELYGPPASITVSGDGSTASVVPTTGGALGLEVVASDGPGRYAYATQSFAARALARLEVESISSSPAVTRGAEFNLTVSVSNTGENPAAIGSPSLTFSPSGSLTASLVAAPASISGGSTETFRFSVKVAPGAVSRAYTPTFAVTAADAATGDPASVSVEGRTPVTVLLPAALSVVGFAAPSTVSRLQTFSATITVRNAGDTSARLTSASLAFSPLAFTVTRVSGPESIPGKGQAEFVYSIATGFSPAARYTPTFTLQAADAPTGADVSLTQRLTPDIVLVTPPALSVAASAGLASSYVPGQSFTATVTFRNSGQAAAKVAATSIAFAPPGNITATQTSGPAVIESNSAGIFQYSCSVGSNAKVGSYTVTPAIVARSAVSNADASSSGLLLARLTVLSLPKLVLDGSPGSVATQRGLTYDLSLPISNSGQTAAAVSAATLTFSPPGFVTATHVSVPGSIAAGERVLLRFSVFTDAMAPLGSYTPALRIAAVEGISRLDSSADLTPEAFRVVSPPSLSFAASTVPGPRARGTSYAGTVTALNSGAAANISATSLTFDPPGNLTATQSSGPAAIAHGLTGTFAYFIELDSFTPAGSYTPTWRFDGVDPATSQPVSGAFGLGSPVSVPAPPAFAFGPLTAPAASIRGRTFDASLAVTNTGGSPANITKATLSFSPAGNFVATQSSGPATLAPGATGLLGFSVLVDRNAAGGTYSTSITLAASDALNGLTVAASSSLAALVTLPQPPALTFSALTAPSSAVRGTSFSAGLTVTNVGGTAFRITSTALTFAPPGNLTATQVSGPTLLAPGSSGAFAWSVQVGARARPRTYSTSCTVFGVDEGGVVGSARTEPLAARLLVSGAELSFGPLTVPQAVVRGSSANVSLTVFNNGDRTANIGSTALTFDPPGQITATKTGGPATIAPLGAAALFSYSINVAAGAPAGTYTPTYRVTATDAGLGSDGGAAAVLAPGLSVLAAPTLVVKSESGLPAQVALSKTYSVTVGLFNPNTVAADVQSSALSLSPPNSDIKLTRTSGVTSIPAQGTGSFVYSVAIGADSLGTYALAHSVTATYTGGTSASRTETVSTPFSVLKSAILRFVAPPHVGQFGFTLPNGLVFRGETYTARITLVNNGGATAHVKSAVLDYGATSGITATMTSPAVSIASNGQAELTFTGRVGPNVADGYYEGRMDVTFSDPYADTPRTKRLVEVDPRIDVAYKLIVLEPLRATATYNKSPAVYGAEPFEVSVVLSRQISYCEIAISGGSTSTANDVARTPSIGSGNFTREFTFRRNVSNLSDNGVFTIRLFAVELNRQIELLPENGTFTVDALPPPDSGTHVALPAGPKAALRTSPQLPSAASAVNLSLDGSASLPGDSPIVAYQFSVSGTNTAGKPISGALPNVANGASITTLNRDDFTVAGKGPTYSLRVVDAAGRSDTASATISLGHPFVGPSVTFNTKLSSDVVVTGSKQWQQKVKTDLGAALGNPASRINLISVGAAAKPSRPLAAGLAVPPLVQTTDMVRLSAEGTLAPPGMQLSYHWRILSAPDQSTPSSPPSTLASLESTTASTTAMRFSTARNGPLEDSPLAAAGEYRVGLSLGAAGAQSPEEQVFNITMTDPLRLPPTASVAPVFTGPLQRDSSGILAPSFRDSLEPAGPLRTYLRLDGRRSAGAAGQGLSYRWRLTAKPAGSSLDLATAILDPATATPLFRPDAEGTYGFNLVVDDGARRSPVVSGAVLVGPSIEARIDSPRIALGAGPDGKLAIRLDAGATGSSGQAGPLETYWTGSVRFLGNAGVSRSFVGTDSTPVFSREFLSGLPLAGLNGLAQAEIGLLVVDRLGGAAIARTSLTTVLSSVSSKSPNSPALSLVAAATTTEATGSGVDFETPFAGRVALRVPAPALVSLEANLTGLPGRVAAFSWTQLDGPPVLLSTTSETAVSRSVTAFAPKTAGTRRFAVYAELLELDANSRPTVRTGIVLGSFIDVVADTFTETVPEPIASAPAASLPAVGSSATQRTVELDATASSAPTGTGPVAYSWRQVEGPAGELEKPFQPLTRFVLPVNRAFEPRLYVLELTVERAGLSSAPKYLAVAQEPLPPQYVQLSIDNVLLSTQPARVANDGTADLQSVRFPSGVTQGALLAVERVDAANVRSTPPTVVRSYVLFFSESASPSVVLSSANPVVLNSRLAAASAIRVQLTELDTLAIVNAKPGLLALSGAASGRGGCSFEPQGSGTWPSALVLLVPLVSILARRRRCSLPS
ncbi:MAG: hypothetical protein HY816_01950 [Candidatus Wallbacteria bacterium]|nr:hypothetical protein [Candidatus Wallbacteria bacterium]